MASNIALKDLKKPPDSGAFSWVRFFCSAKGVVPHHCSLGFVVAQNQNPPPQHRFQFSDRLLNPSTPAPNFPWQLTWPSRAKSAYCIGHRKAEFAMLNVEFLTALVAAMNDRAKLSELEKFPKWRNQPPVPLDTPWPD